MSRDRNAHTTTCPTCHRPHYRPEVASELSPPDHVYPPPGKVVGRACECDATLEDKP